MNGDIVWGDGYSWSRSEQEGLIPVSSFSVSYSPTLIQQKSITGKVSYERQGDAVRTITMQGVVTAEFCENPMSEVRQMGLLVDGGYRGYLSIGDTNLGCYVATSYNYSIIHIIKGFVQTVQWSLTLSECSDPSDEETKEKDEITFNEGGLDFSNDEVFVP